MESQKLKDLSGLSRETDEGEGMLSTTSTSVSTTPKSKFEEAKKSFCFRMFVAQWVFSLASAIFAYFFLADIIQDMVNKSLAIRAEADSYHMWEQPPIIPDMKIFLFNVTNVDRWLKGIDAKLKVNQIGPYVYREHLNRANVTFSSDGETVSYRMFKKYKFVPEKSSPEDETVIIPNIPLFGAAAFMKDADSFTLMGFKAFTSMMGSDSTALFLTKTVKEVLWGFDMPLTSMASMTSTEEDGIIPGKFGLMLGKNNTFGPLQTINTGASDIRKIGNVLAYRNKTEFQAWGTKECNQVHGRDGGYFSPGIHSSDTVSIFVPEICSAIRLKSEGEEVLYGDGNIKTLRFKSDPHTFDYQMNENKCFCTSKKEKTKTQDLKDNLSGWFSDFFEEPAQKKNDVEKTTKEYTCPQNGVLNIDTCRSGAPMAVSWPLFYQAGEENPSSVIEGLPVPNASDHEFRIDIQPDMGIGMATNVRLQINLRIEESPVLQELPKLESSFLLPVMWFDNTIEKIPNEITTMLNEALSVGPTLALKTFLIVMFVLGIEVVLASFYFLIQHRSSKDKRKANLQSISI